MARLPQPGGDPGQWGDLLNTFLSVSHNADGSLKNGSVPAAALNDGSVTASKISSAGAPTTGQALTYNGSGLAWTTVNGGGTVADATTSTKGIVQLAGDLAGTSANPTVPGLAAKANDSTVVHLTGTETITGNKNFTGSLQSAGAAVVTTIDARLTNARTPSDDSVTTAKILDEAVTEPKLAASNTPVNGQLLSYNGSTFTWVAAPAGGSDPIMGGDISGNASSATIANNAVITAKIANDAVTEPKLGTTNVPSNGQILSYNGANLTWIAAPTGSGDPTVGGDLTGTASNAQIANLAVGTAQIADTAITAAKVADNSITEPKLSISNAPATNQVLSWSGTQLVWATPTVQGGGSTWSASSITASATALSGQFVIADASAGSITVTLPAPANGAYVTVKKLDNTVNAVLVAPPSGNINAGSGTSATISVNNYGMVADFIADGTQWHQVG